MRSVLPAICLALTMAGSVSAHLGAPATFDMVEESQGRFRVTLTLPIVEGRIVRARPVLPDVCRVDGEAATRSGPMTATREWTMSCRPADLQGAALGLAGLLGTAQEVALTLSTLDGRVYRQTLRPTQTFFVVPMPRPALEITASSLRDGIRHAALRPDLWVLLFCFAATGVSVRRGLAAAILWGVGHAVGRLLSGSLGWTIPDSLAIALSGATGAGLAIFSLSGAPVRRRLRCRWPVYIAATLLGLLAGSALSGSTQPLGLSFHEQYLASVAHAGGVVAAAVWIAVVTGPFCSAVTAGGHRLHLGTALLYLGGICAAAVGVYHFAGFVEIAGPVLADAWGAVRPRLAARYVAPFTGDWAMGIVRIPLLSLLLVVCAAVLLLRGRLRPGGRRTQAALSAALLLGAAVLSPSATFRLRTPLFRGHPPSPAQCRRILEPLLAQVYLALNIAEESEAYDRLAEQVSGALTTDLYLDSRRRLVAGTRGGATVVVRGVNVAEVDEAYSRGTAQPEFTYPCRWIVTARVTHWQHSHDRRNVYEGDLTLTVEDDRWKLAALDLRTEEREVVPGSFASR